MAVLQLHLVVLNAALIVLDGALVLQHQLFLIVDGLRCNGIFCQGIAVALQIHLRLGQYVLVALQRPLCLQQRRLIGARIDVDQRIALAYLLTLLE